MAKVRTRYTNFRRACRQDIKYRRGRRRSFICSYGVLWILGYASSTDDCPIFEEKRSSLDCTYGDNDNVSVSSCWMEQSARREITHSLQGRWHHSLITLAHPAASGRRSSVHRHIRNSWKEGEGLPPYYIRHNLCRCNLAIPTCTNGWKNVLRQKEQCIMRREKQI